NQYEADAIAKQFKSADWSRALKNEPSEICIINTCTVTQKASMQSRQAVRRAIRANPTARIVVTGCYAQTEPDAVEKIKGVHYIVGNAGKNAICDMIRTDKNPAPAHPLTICRDIQPALDIEPGPDVISGNRTRPFFKIQDGCDAFCTYCIIPYARGPSRSKPLESVLAGIQGLASSGYQEIVLTGIHLGNYGSDLVPKTCLGELIERIDDLNLIPRVRLSSIEPLELTDEIIRRVTESNILCRHFHIPLQSGDDHILRKMGRPYRAEDFRQLITKIHDRLPDAAIGVDTLIGFPGETDSAFENTYALIEALPVAYLHVFPFSPRPGTPAADYPDKVSPRVIKRRCQRMRALGSAKRNDFYGRFVGQELEILIETTRHRPTGLLKGLSSNYIPILVDADDAQKNTLVVVNTQKRIDDGLLGSII
ncbi:MAG: tRNA (N(6)-L-threonylcarbamoyladenosine(37)-C(2))-methylthiotransferase MtaB, partial [Deltaproteobacteria bacterium]|nr:tRNA (N(6)-L-threonylcarbamoyladenosine(37)-C(2))-methylthiotransferase MtaB [Deltaproteobacteria bacterium]